MNICIMYMKIYMTGYIYMTWYFFQACFIFKYIFNVLYFTLKLRITFDFVPFILFRSFILNIWYHIEFPIFGSLKVTRLTRPYPSRQRFSDLFFRYTIFLYTGTFHRNDFRFFLFLAFFPVLLANLENTLSR